MPDQDPANALSLGEGGTVLLDTPRLGKLFGFDQLKLKDEGRNPTGSFKSRGLASAVSRAKELGASAVWDCSPPPVTRRLPCRPTRRVAVSMPMSSCRRMRRRS